MDLWKIYRVQLDHRAACPFGDCGDLPHTVNFLLDRLSRCARHVTDIFRLVVGTDSSTRELIAVHDHIKRHISSVVTKETGAKKRHNPIRSQGYPIRSQGCA